MDKLSEKVRVQKKGGQEESTMSGREKSGMDSSFYLFSRKLKAK